VRSLAFSFYEIYLKCFSSQLQCSMFDMEVVLGFHCFSPVPVIPDSKMQGFPEPYKLRRLFPFDSIKEASDENVV